MPIIKKISMFVLLFVAAVDTASCIGVVSLPADANTSRALLHACVVYCIADSIVWVQRK